MRRKCRKTSISMDTERAETRRCHGDHGILVLTASYSAAPSWVDTPDFPEEGEVFC